MKLAQRLRAAFRSIDTDGHANAYLNEATSIVDLERRQKEIDTGLFRPRRFPY